MDPALNCNNIIKNLNDVNYASEVFYLIRREMSDVESFLKGCNAYWNERYTDAEIITEYSDLYDRHNLGKGYDKILNPNCYTKVNEELKKYFPLRSFAFSDGSGICNVYSIIWSDIITNNATRYVKFTNNGQVAMGRQGNKNSSKIDYNILDSTFNYRINTNRSTNNEIEFTSDGRMVTKKYKNCTNKYDLVNGTRDVTIDNNNDKRNIRFRYRYSKDNKLINFRCEIDTKKNNGSINGRYIVEVGEDYIKPVYISRKGTKTDLRFDLEHAYEFKDLLDDYLYNPGKYVNTRIEYDLGIKAIDIMNGAYRLETLNDMKMSDTIKRDLRTIDNSIKAYIGEIPFPRLENTMKDVLRRSSLNIREKRQVKVMTKKRYNYKR